MDGVLFAVGLGALLLATLSYFFVRRLTAPGVGHDDIQRIENFSLDSYRPMGRLLDEQDLEFLRAQPGYVPGLDRKLRSQRCAIYRAYLRSLSKDFGALHRAARTIVANASEDQPELSTQLFRQGVRFWIGMSVIHCKLTLYSLNLYPSSISAEGLVNAIANMQTQMFVPNAAAAAN